MDKKKVSYEELLRLILPGEIFEFFDVIKVDAYEKEVHLFVDEKNVLPYSFNKGEYQSKGFYPEAIIQDYPLRDKAVFIHARRRKWQNVLTSEILSNNFNLTEKGTRYSPGFASFLKGILGFIPNQQ
ncbi:MAG: hypothetical protein IKT74_07490 [Bacteroidales bacterium]|jgi:hypothetical protein|nr:hypothetical protein [Bacteroidales bacterium]